LCVVGAVLLGLGSAGSVEPAAEPAVSEASAVPQEPARELAQGHGKLGVAPFTPDASTQEDLERRLVARGMKVGSPMLIRIFKSEAELELWMEVGERFELFATYAICNWSGSLGPKLTEGDKQSPEGIYSIGPRQLRHSARWRRSLDVGFPNAFDRLLKRSGSDVLLHGGCTSTGCFAMTDPAIEEIYRLAQAALASSQRRIQVHVFPFRMTPENLAAHAGSAWSGFWSDLKEASDLFDRTRQPPSVSVCNGRYAVSATDTEADGCREIVGAGESADSEPDTVRRPTARRRPRRNVMQAYAVARLAAKARQRQASHIAGQRRLRR
jgi:murein L,D-transpeptidase YafK